MSLYVVPQFIPAVPNLFDTRHRFPGKQFFHGLEEGGWFRDDSSTLYLLCPYNEISIRLTIMQNQWEPCFPATRWFHLGVMGDTDTPNVLLMSSLLRDLVLVAVTAENPASQRQDVGNGSRLFSAFVAISGYSALTLIQNIWRFEVVSNILLRSHVICDLKQLILYQHKQSRFTWLIHKWIADPFLPSLGVFCGWEVMLKLF